MNFTLYRKKASQPRPDGPHDLLQAGGRVHSTKDTKKGAGGGGGVQLVLSATEQTL